MYAIGLLGLSADEEFCLNRRKKGKNQYMLGPVIGENDRREQEAGKQRWERAHA